MQLLINARWSVASPCTRGGVACRGVPQCVQVDTVYVDVGVVCAGVDELAVVDVVEERPALSLLERGETRLCGHGDGTHLRRVCVVEQACVW